MSIPPTYDHTVRAPSSLIGTDFAALEGDDAADRAASGEIEPETVNVFAGRYRAATVRERLPRQLFSRPQALPEFEKRPDAQELVPAQYASTIRRAAARHETRECGHDAV